MNIFVVDNDPIVAAQMLCDSHVCKMILEGFDSSIMVFCALQGAYANSQIIPK